MKYKQTLLVYLVILVLVPQFFLQAQVTRLISSGTVTQEMAQEAAQTFLLKEQTAPPQIATKTRGKLIVRNQAVGLALGEILPITDESGAVLAYVQELKPEGFVIISADDVIGSVLGFSFTGKFSIDDSQANPLLYLVKADVDARKGLASLGKAETVGLGSSTQWGPWLQTEWKQSGHWNNKCPYAIANIPGIRRLVGCVATATAQIVNYWQYPSSMSFSSSDDSYSSDKIDIFGDAGKYGFPTASELSTVLQNILYNGDSDEEAYLCFGIGVKLRMDYGVFASGANTYSVRNVLNNDFGYGSAIADTDLSGVWSLHSSEIVEDLKNSWPVQIAIHKSGKRGGHSIVVDGYRDNDQFFHLNYGWGDNSPDPISTAWYNIPTNIPSYDVVHTVVYGIAKYQGWNQIGADQRNSYHAIYPAPIDQPVRKWPVNVPAGLPIYYSYSHLVVGAGGRIYASLGPSILGDIYHPYIVIYDKFGTWENLIEVTHSNVDISYLCQNSRGEIFFPSGTAGPTATDSKVFRLNPKTDEITPIFTHSSPDPGSTELIKVDRDNYLYFVVQPRVTTNYAKFYCISRTGINKWTPYSFPSSAEFHRTIPAIDEDRDRVYLNYFEKTEEYKGRSHLIAFKRSNRTVVFNEILPNVPTHDATAMAGAPSISEDGTVYIGAYTSLYAYSNNGTKLWEKSFYPAYTYGTPAIGSDGTLYVNYGKMVSGNWRPGYVRALNPANGDTKWEMSLSLSEFDHMSDIYAAANGMVIYSYDKDGQNRLGGVKDNGTSYESRWDMEGGGTLAFGPGRTIFSIPPGHDQSIWALTDSGDRGDPEGKGMDYADNGQPFSPSPLSPSDGAVDQDTTSVQLSWAGSDPDGHVLTYDVYACALVEGEEAAFAPVANQVTGNSYTLTNLLGATQYLWSVVATDGQTFSEGQVWSFSTEGVAIAVEDDEGVAILPKKYELRQNYPNPFNSSTTISFQLPKISDVRIKVYNTLGQEVKTLLDKRFEAGSYSVIWDGSDKAGTRVGSGVYLYRIETEGFIQTKKSLLLR